jgi:hypothetical protein
LVESYKQFIFNLVYHRGEIIMKRFLVALMAVTSLGVAATAANAEDAAKGDSELERPCVGQSCDVDFKGEIYAACDCKSKNGALGKRGLSNYLSSKDTALGGKTGSITTVCNTKKGTVTYAIKSASAPAIGDVTPSFSIDGGATFVTTLAPIVIGNSTSTVAVDARFDSKTAKPLEAGTYTMTVSGTHAP